MTYRLVREYAITGRAHTTVLPVRLSGKVIPKGAYVDYVSDQYVPKDHPLWEDARGYRMAWFFTAFGLVPLNLDDVERFS